MKTIEVDDELYSYIASHTKHIGESASDILRRMLKFSAASQPAAPVTKEVRVASPAIVEVKPVKTIKDKVRAMRELLLSDEYAEQKRAVNRFMLLLSTLYSLDAQRLPKQRNRCTVVHAFTLRQMNKRC